LYEEEEREAQLRGEDVDRLRRERNDGENTMMN